MRKKEALSKLGVCCWMTLLMGILGLINSAEGYAGADEIASAIVSAGGVSHGLCCVVGGAGTELPVALAEASGLLVHVIDADAAAVQAGRDAAAKKGLGIKRLLIERMNAGPLPHADNTLDLVLVPETSKEILSGLSAQEVLRALRPRGKAILCVQEERGVSRGTLEDWAKKASLKLAGLDKALEGGSFSQSRRFPARTIGATGNMRRTTTPCRRTRRSRRHT